MRSDDGQQFDRALEDLRAAGPMAVLTQLGVVVHTFVGAAGGKVTATSDDEWTTITIRIPRVKHGDQ